MGKQMIKVLIIEDDRNLATVVSKILIAEDFNPDIAYDGTTGLAMALENRYSVILLDLMLPGVDGLTICKKLKEEGVGTPIIMVTARGDISDRVNGLNAGADDYLPKPFSPKELIARIHAVARRTMKGTPEGVYQVGDLSLDVNTGELSCVDEKVILSEKEKLILSSLMGEPGTVKDKQTLLRTAWGDDADNVDLNNVEAYISFLRKKLAFIGSKVQIKTLRKVGYKIEIP